MYLPVLDKKWLDKGIELLSEGPIVPRLSVRLWMKSDGINLIPQGETLIWLVPLETEVYMELTKDLMGRACCRGSLDKKPFPPLDQMTSWPILNSHPSLIMNRFRDQGLVHMITEMPKSDYRARELEDCSA
jgi:hypothetical protein